MLDNIDQVRRTLESIFQEIPSESTASFVPSALFDRRYTASHSARGGSGHVLSEMPRLDAAAATRTRLAPAEAHLAGELFANDGIVLVTSGSGSGKTSVLNHLREYSRSMLTTGTGRPYPAGEPLLAIDFQSAPDSLKMATDERAEQSAKVLEFISTFAEYLDGLLDRADAMALTSAVRSVLEPSELLSKMDEVAKVRRKLIATRGVQSQLKPPQDPERALLKAFDQSASPGERLVARLMVFTELAKQQRDTTDVGLVLAIDNIDPFPEFLQSALIDAVRTVSNALRPADAAMPNGLTVAIFARISTARRHVGALDGIQARRVEYRSPDPAEIVFFRLAAFLAQPERNANYVKLSVAGRHAVEMRCLALFERLLDAGDLFHRVLSGLAGSNIRTGCKFAKKWLLSGRLDDSGLDELRPSRQAVEQIVALGLILRCAQGLSRSLASASVATSSDDAVERLFRRVESSVSDLIATNGLYQEALSGVTEDATRNTLRSNLVRRLGKEVAAGIASPAACSEALAPATAAAAAFVSNLRLSHAELDSMAESLRARLSQRSGGSERLSALHQKLLDAVVEGVRGKDAPISRPALRAFRLTYAARVRTKPSRWEAVQILLGDRSKSNVASPPEDQIGALNVFSADGKSLSPTALFALGVVEADASVGVDGSALRAKLSIWGFSDEQQSVALHALVHVDCRLIFSGVHDSQIGLAGWWDAAHRVSLSSAGYEYLYSVVPTPAYLQWALAKIIPSDDPYRESGVRRIAHALSGLKAMAADESRRLDRFRNGRHVPFDRALVPFTQVFYRCLPEFVSDLSGLQSEDPKGAREVAAAFATFSRELHSLRRGAFRHAEPEWEIAIDIAERLITTRFHLSSSPA